MFVDFILNGQGHGEVAEAMAGCRYDPGLMRPYMDEKGRKCVTINTGRTQFDKDKKMYLPVYENVPVAELMAQGISSPVFNATALRKDEWIQLDTVVLEAARQRLRAWADLAAANTFGGFNGMGKMLLEHETVNDPGSAVVDMDGLSDTPTNDTPLYQLEGLPLPITHSGFYISQRRLAASRNTGTPLDLSMAAYCGRRVAEMVEKTLIGVETGLTYGRTTDYGRTPSVYGYTNFPDRITKTDLTTPLGTNPEAIVTDVIEMRELLYTAKFYGPFMLYHTPAYDRYLDDDYFRSGSTSIHRTVRERIASIDGISGVRRLDFWSGSAYQLLLVQMTPDVARAVIGMNLTTLQWESKGGLRLDFKVMAINVPQLRADYNGNCGICHGTTS